MPAQLRAYSTVVLLGPAHAAADELGMCNVGVATPIAQPRKEFDDPL